MSLASKSKEMIEEFKEFTQLCDVVMKTPHYAKMGREGVCAILAKAQMLGMNGMHALNGGLYYVQGKVEMAAQTMRELIFAAGHEIHTIKSDAQVCIVKGIRRGKNGEILHAEEVSYTMEEARAAGLVGKDNWKKHMIDMLQARATSRLGRRLFPDVISGCYVKGEIQSFKEEEVTTIEAVECVEKRAPVSLEEYCPENIERLWKVMDEIPDYKAKVEEYMVSQGIEDMYGISSDLYQSLLAKTKMTLEKNRKEKEETSEGLREKISGLLNRFPESHGKQKEILEKSLKECSALQGLKNLKALVEKSLSRIA